MDAPDVVVLGAERANGFSIRFNASKSRVLGVVGCAESEELVGKESVGVVEGGGIGFVVGFGGSGVGEEGLDVIELDLLGLIELIDESARDFDFLGARVEFVDGFGFGVEVLCVKSHSIRADTQVGIFADQDGLVFGVFFAEAQCDSEDLAVRVVGILEDA